MTEIPVYILIALRFAFASIVQSVLANRRSPRVQSRITNAGLLRLIVMSLVGSVLYTAIVLEGIKRPSAVDAGIISATLPLAVALLGLAWLGRIISLRQAVVVALAAVGLLAVLFFDQAQSNTSQLGNPLILFAVMCEASYFIVSQSVSVNTSPTHLALRISLLSLLFSLSLALHEVAMYDIASISARIWTIAILYTLLASIFCPILWFRDAAFVTFWQASLATMALPIAAIAVSTIMIKESISQAQWLGAGIVILAITLGAFWRTPTATK